MARDAERGELAGVAKKRGPRGGSSIRSKKLAEQRRRSAGGRSAEQAEALVELQKQVGALLGTPLATETW